MYFCSHPNVEVSLFQNVSGSIYLSSVLVHKKFSLAIYYSNSILNSIYLLIFNTQKIPSVLCICKHEFHALEKIIFRNPPTSKAYHIDRSGTAASANTLPALLAQLVICTRLPIYWQLPHCLNFNLMALVFILCLPFGSYSLRSKL